MAWGRDAFCGMGIAAWGVFLNRQYDPEKRMEDAIRKVCHLLRSILCMDFLQGGQPSSGAWVYLSYGNGRDPDRSDTKCSGNIRAYYVRDHNYYSGNHISLFCG